MIKSITKRIIVSKILGFIIGVISAFIMNYFFNASLIFCFGIALWYATIGSVIGIFGIFAKNPIFDFKYNPLVRSALIGA